jgi:hypothetical protein
VAAASAASQAIRHGRLPDAVELPLIPGLPKMPSGGATFANSQLRCIRTIYLSDDLTGMDIQKNPWERALLLNFAEAKCIIRRQ